jgi:hypothetical protein
VGNIVILFKEKRTSLFNNLYVDYKEKINVDDVIQKDITVVVKYYNNILKSHNIIYLPIEDIEELNNLYIYQLNEIEINTVCYLRNNNNNVNNVNNNIINTIDNDSKFLKTIYKINKNTCRSDIRGLYIKIIIEYIYSYYEFDYLSRINFNDFYEDFQIHNFDNCRIQLNIILSDTNVYNILKYLGFNIDKNDILYLKKKKKKEFLKIDLNLDSDIKNIIAPKYNHHYHNNYNDLRGNIYIKNSNPNVSFWSVSSKIG